jgi:hypothetical protein
MHEVPSLIHWSNVSKANFTKYFLRITKAENESSRTYVWVRLDKNWFGSKCGSSSTRTLFSTRVRLVKSSRAVRFGSLGSFRFKLETQLKSSTWIFFYFTFRYFIYTLIWDYLFFKSVKASLYMSLSIDYNVITNFYYIIVKCLSWFL